MESSQVPWKEKQFRWHLRRVENHLRSGIILQSSGVRGLNLPLSWSWTMLCYRTWTFSEQHSETSEIWTTLVQVRPWEVITLGDLHPEFQRLPAMHSERKGSANRVPSRSGSYLRFCFSKGGVFLLVLFSHVVSWENKDRNMCKQ